MRFIRLYPTPPRRGDVNYHRRKLIKGKAMNEVGMGRGTAHSPDSDCNSNHPGSVSCLSNTSSQDIDFIQDNSDYQWFLDYNYRDGSTNHHTSILSLSESYGANDVGYYDALAKNMDANLAEADMESFRTEDIHALLTNLPAMCSDPLSQETNRQGESFASVSGSMMAKFDFDGSLSPHTSSQGEDSATSMSICKSELLFSPVKETPMPGANFSVDSLDCELMTEEDILLTCQANKDNYTIAFEGSITMYSEESDYHESDKSEGTSGTGSNQWTSDLKLQTLNLKRIDSSMAQSDSAGFTTWSKLKKRSSENQLRRHPSGNNNSSGEDNSHFIFTENTVKSQSMPNLYKQKLKGLLTSNYLKSQHDLVHSTIDPCNVRRKSVKVFDIQHQTQSGSSGCGGSVLSDMATSADGGSSCSENNNKQQNFSLVKLFMKQKSMSAEGMSTAMDQSSASDNWPANQSGESNHSLDVKDGRTENFEDSLLIDRKTNENLTRTHGLIVEEQEEEISKSESLEGLSESISKLESVVDSYENEIPSQNLTKFSINNNNSFESEKAKIRLKIHATQTKRNNSSTSFSSDTSCSSYSAPVCPANKFSAKNNTTQIPIHLMNKSMQTSCFADVNNLKNAPYKLNCNNGREVVKVIEPSFLTKLKKKGECQKPVYVLYPNYVLPDLDFLNEKSNSSNVVLMPQNGPKNTTAINKKRPFSCNDVETLKKKGFSHVQDWESLNFLLPNEYRQILADVPEVAEKITNPPGTVPSFVRHRQRPVSCDYTGMLERTNSLDRATNVSSSSSTATQPSSGYRGSSTMLLTDSQNSPAPTANLNPLFVYRYDSVTSSEASLLNEKQRSITTTAPPLPKRSISLSHEKRIDITPPRPPLPKGILRKGLENAKLRKCSDRYSMLDVYKDGAVEEKVQKRRSLQEPYYLVRNKRLSETEDEGVDAGTSSSSLEEQTDAQPKLVHYTRHNQKSDVLLSNISCDELAQLEEYFKISGISTSDEELNEESIIQLRSYVSKFLSLKINQEGSDNFGGKKCVSFAEKVNVLPKPSDVKSTTISAASNMINQRHFPGKAVIDTAICEEGETSPESFSSPQHTSAHMKQTFDLSQKRSLISAVTDAVEKVIHHFSPATNQTELITIGDSSQNPAGAKLALSTLCPALYAVLSDGLKPTLDTPFGPINNSVWQVVEASAQQGPLTKALNELVLRINGEDVLTEGLVKFNAFVFGLLNVRSLDAWGSYLRTRESVLKKHYKPDSLMVLAHTGGPSFRGLLDTLISTLEPLALLPFQFDLLFEYWQLHLSLKRMDSYQQPPSPTHALPSPSKLSPKQSFMKVHLMHSNSSQSNSETEEVITTLRHKDPSLPDLLDSSAYTKTKNDKPRPRSCVDPGSKPNFKLGEDVTAIVKKRWSGISLSSRLYQAYDKLGNEETEEEYTDSLETTHHNKVAHADKIQNELINLDQPESLDSNISDEKPLNGKKFRKLQRKWEMLSGQNSSNSPSPPLSPTHTKSKIPRPVTSPVRPSGIPVPIASPTSKTGGKAIPKKIIISPNGNKRTVSGIVKTPSGSNLVKNSPSKKCGLSTRTSRLDQLDTNSETPKHIMRPSSLPYRPASVQNHKGVKAIPPRRAVSSSLNRTKQSQTPKVVRTLCHRLPSESGHLPYNEGERLKVVLEVDEKWLLCCRGTQKGLVPKSAVIADTGKF